MVWCVHGSVESVPVEGSVMSEVEGIGCAKKQRLDLDFDKCFEDSNDDPPPEIIIVKSSSSGFGADGGENLDRLSDQELQDKIRRIAANLASLGPKLRDKGEKLKSNLRAHEEERDRRKHRTTALKSTNEAKIIFQTESSRPTGASPEVKVGARSGSGFADLFAQNLDNDKHSHTRIYDAFDKEPRTICLGDRDRRKRKLKPRLTDKGRDKSGISWKGDLCVASSQRIFPLQDDLAPNKDRHNLKNAFKGLHSGKSFIDKIKPLQTVVLLDEEETELEETTSIAEEEEMRDMIIYYPSRNDPECVEVQYKDLKCLHPGQYLTSPIMNFCIRFLQVTSAGDDAPRDYHFFNTYFYKKLQEAVSLQNSDKEASFFKLRRWWRGVNIFEKAYIFLPVHDDLHWSLAIVCIPDKEDEYGPIILHLDSLGYHNSGSIFDNIRRFLREEWEIVREETDLHVPFTNQIWENLPARVEEKIITVPRQNNDSDCGLFVLYFMERFIKDAPQRLRKQDLGMFGRHWFKPEEASGLRRKTKTTLLDEFRKARSMREPVTVPHGHDDSKEEIIEA